MGAGYHKIHSRPQREGTNCQASRAPRVGLRGGRNRRYSLAERLAARTEKGPSCWFVAGHALPNGYVQFHTRVNGKLRSLYAHRLAYELAKGPIPDGLTILHSCDTPRCVNPEHLTVGTQRDNVLDSIRKGRWHAHYITGRRLNGQPSKRRGYRPHSHSDSQLHSIELQNMEVA